MEPNILPHGAIVKGTNHTYIIDKMIGKGGYGITYLATIPITLNGDLGDIAAEAKVTLKEFYIPSLMTRQGDTIERDFTDTVIDAYARCFYMEADTISALSHPNIVKVLEVFVANNTCYYAMEYLSGGSLHDYINKHRYLHEAEALKYIRQIGSAISHMHANRMVHLDIKPKNIMFGSNGQVKLIDYGLAHRYDNEGELELADGLGCGTPGYAPLEQADADAASTFAPTMDIYALGATYYKMLIGDKPANAFEVKNHGLDTKHLALHHVSQQSIDAIKAAMQPAVSDRLQSVDDFIAMLPDIPETDAPKRRHITKNTITLVLFILIFIIAIIIAIMKL